LRREMQMIFQDPFTSLNPRMTLLDLVGEPLLVHGMRSRREREARVADLLRRVGLRPEYMRRFPHAFSGCRASARAMPMRWRSPPLKAWGNRRAGVRAGRLRPGPDPESLDRPAGRV